VIVVIIKVKKGEQELIIEPEERKIISAADEKIKRLSSDDKELIESIINNKLNHCDLTHPNPFLPTSIGKSLEIILGPSAATVLLHIIINPIHIKITLDKLKEEGLLTENTIKFIFELAAKYGDALHTLMLNVERPHDWIRLTSNPVILENIPKLQSKIWRADGEVFQFTSTLEDTIIFAEHFIRKISETINSTDKERVLDLDKAWLDELEKSATELKELYESVKSEIEKIEHSETKTTN